MNLLHQVLFARILCANHWVTNFLVQLNRFKTNVPTSIWRETVSTTLRIYGVVELGDGVFDG